MMERLGRIVLTLLCVLLPLGSSASAQTAAPLPAATPAPAASAPTARPAATAAPTPVAFTAHAHADLNVVAQGTTYNGTARVAVAQRGNLTRVDMSAAKSDAVPLAPIAFTIVVDRGANTISAWNDATRLYRTQRLILHATPSATPKPKGTPGPGSTGVSPFGKLDVFAVSITLTGHTTTAGLPATGLALDAQVRKRGETATSHVTATMQLADDFPFLPLAIDVSVEPGAAPLHAHASYALDDLVRVAPAADRFVIPAGYTEAPSFVGVLFPHGPVHRPAPPPTPRH